MNEFDNFFDDASGANACAVLGEEQGDTEKKAYEVSKDELDVLFSKDTRDGVCGLIILPNECYFSTECEEHYIIHSVSPGVWTCLKKQAYNQAKKDRFDALFNEVSEDGISMVTYWGNCEDPTKEGGDDYYYFPMRGPVSTLWVCVRKSALTEKSAVKFKVPERIIGKVIGRDGKNIKQIAKELGVKYIKVVAV